MPRHRNKGVDEYSVSVDELQSGRFGAGFPLLKTDSINWYVMNRALPPGGEQLRIYGKQVEALFYV